MAKNSDILENFELILKENAVHQIPILYSGNKHEKPGNNGSKLSLGVEQVICNVSRQIKAIQSADCRKNNRAATVNISKYKKSTFIPVNMLDGAELMPQNKNLNKFETQCVTDTQLINIVQDAEELVSHRGMTQEFDTTFCTQEENVFPAQIVNDKDDSKMITGDERKENNLVNNKESIFPIIDISLKEPDRTDDVDSLFDEGDKNDDEQVLIEIKNQFQVETLENESVVEDRKRQDNPDEIDLPSSPVFDVKAVKKSTPVFDVMTVKKSKSQPPLVFELETFEQFEKIALPIVEKNTDQETAICLINSQISGKELCLQSKSSPDIYENDKQQVSPLIEWSKNKFQFDQDAEYLPEKEKSVPETKSTQSSILKDEIIFSSDEENDCGLQEYYVEDLPFTCALATSFYEQPNVLDQTMYVGFQTASNKSIKICTESFYKAKSILDDFETDVSGKPTLTELVEICDGQNPTSLTDSIKVDDNISVTNNMKTVCRDTIEFLDSIDDNTTPEQPVNQLPTLKDLSERSINISEMFEGFKTASNKKIFLSEKALQQSKNIFKDIDLSENNNCEHITAKNTTNKSSEYKIIENEGCVLQQETVKDKKELKLDESIWLEFENNDMSHENVDKYKTADLVGVETASNKNIQISDIALDKYNKIFQDKEYFDDDTRAAKTDLIMCTKQSHFGFKTASNKEIKISDQAVAKTKIIFSDLEAIDDKGVNFECPQKQLNNTDLEKDIWGQPSTSKTPCVGFKTATKIFQDKESFDDDTRAEKTDLIMCTKQSHFGFKTASNKEIKISDQAVAKTKIIFSDLEAIDDKGVNFECPQKQLNNTDLEKYIWDQPSTSKTPCVGFKTASNKEITISEVALAKTKKIFDDISSNEVYANENNAGFVKPKPEYPNKVTSKRPFDDIDDKNTLKSTNFIGFQTASNKRIKISEEALRSSRNIFEEIEKDTNNKENINKLLKNMESDINEIQFEGFQTASNKPLVISKDAIEKSKAIFENFDVIDDNQNSSKRNKSPTSFKGFQTASNKPINITEQSLSKSYNLFENIDTDIDTKEIEGDNLFKGFKTASNKFITISADALVKSKKVFENIDDVTEETSFRGFQTANNKKVEISEDALARSKKIFENVDLHKNTIDIAKGINFKGFQTASNKTVTISEQALAKSRKIFENIDVETEPIESVKKCTFEGFQTASNKKINISETALSRSNKIFENINTDIELDEANVTKSNVFQGFQTGNSKKINISERALTQSRRLLENIDDEKYVPESPRGSPFRGFQTANNREVKISKEVLAKAKRIFQDMDIISEISDSSTDLAKSQVIPVKSANNTTQNGSKDPESILSDSICKLLDKQTKSNTKEHIATCNSVSISKDRGNIENVIDTQLLSDFDKSLHTEDFSKEITPVKSKRSGSPILSCPKSKRRKKFETPYNKTQKTIAPAIVEKVNKYDDKKLEEHIFDKNYKKTKKYNLSNIHNMEKDNIDTQNSVDPYILEHKFENLLKFEFFGTRNEISNEKLSTEDLKKYFLNSVNKNFVPDGWIDNHLKLIIWKLISYEIKFPNTLGIVCTSKNVIEQLKYRYDKELFNSERPALRKILEKDDVSTKLMVLCVAAVYEDGTVNVDKVANQNTLELLLTDGWYCVRACLDRMLSKLVVDGKIAVGSKIVTTGAELVGCDQGIAPWEDTSQVRLKLSGNSTRRARWLTRLGYHGNGAILSRLRDVSPDGGRVARLRVFVARVYPTLYIEKFDDGSTVTRSERLEILYQMKYENERQALLEKLYEEVQKEFSDEEPQDSEADPELKRRWLNSGSQIAKAMKKSRDPAEFGSNLTETQVELLNDHTTRERDRLIQDVQARVEERIVEAGLNVRRNVVPLMKIRIADVSERENVEVTRGLMSIWKPNDAITEIVKEGAWIDVVNVIPTAIRYSEIQISAGRQSIFSQSKHKESEKLQPYTKSMQRICYPIKDLTTNPSMTTEYNEIDTLGLIFLIEPSSKEFDSNKHQFQNVYLADADKNIICLNFWGGLKKVGFENILDTGQVVAGMNLQKRAGNTRKNIPQYRVTEFSYFTKTPKNDIARNTCEDFDKKLQGVDRMKFCDDCVTLKNNYSVFKMRNYNEYISPYRCQNIDLNMSKNKMFIDSPLAAMCVKNHENLNLSGLDFESTFKQVDTQEYSPKTILRKRQIKEKINKLKMYGEPPALSPIQILNKSKNAGSAFKSPLPKSDVSTSVANAPEILLKEKNAESSVPGSPVILNKTFVKRTNVNPVKLDFSNVAINESNVSDSNVAINKSNVSDSIDHFAEDFDGSPPLSLD